MQVRQLNINITQILTEAVEATKSYTRSYIKLVTLQVFYDWRKHLNIIMRDDNFVLTRKMHQTLYTIKIMQSNKL